MSEKMFKVRLNPEMGLDQDPVDHGDVYGSFLGSDGFDKAGHADIPGMP
ncbi:MAG: hypothetical protein KKD44_17035 [Proteobacteria bacterium]|nr:hypothetical protein [Pseudomonadota bacterium]